MSEAKSEESSAEGATLNAMLERWAKWIVNNPPKYGGDHACAECYPHSEILKEGFVCVYHQAKRLHERSNTRVNASREAASR